MKEKLEKILNKGKTFLMGAGLVSLLSTSAVIGCGPEDDSGGNYNPQASTSKYYCSCKGDGLFVTADAYATSLSAAESAATYGCREEYPWANCNCSCKKVSSSSNGGGNDYPSCDSVPPDYDGVCINI